MTYNGRKIHYEVIPKPLAYLPSGKEDTTYYNQFLQGGSGTEGGDIQRMDDFAKYVHIHRIIQNRAFKFGYALHREMMAAWHPWFNALIYKISKALTKDEIRIVKPETKDDEEPEIREDLMDFWRENNLQDMLYLALIKMKMHGPIAYFPFEPPEYWDRPGWHIFAEDQMKPEVYDDFGHPVQWKISPRAQNVEAYSIYLKGYSNKTAMKDGIPKSKSYSKTKYCLWFDAHNTENFHGKREGNNMWDSLIDYLFIIDNWRAFLQRIGNGFLILGMSEDTTPDEETQIDTKMNQLRTETGLKLRQSKESPITVDWMQTGNGNTGFIECITKMEDSFAVAMGYPKRWLMGDQEGAMESSGKDALQVNIKMKEDFNFFVPRFVKGVLKFHDKISSEDEVEILPGFSTAMSEQEKAELDEIKTSTIALKSWCTPNEQRELDGMEPLSEEGADDLMMQQEMDIEREGMEMKSNDANIKKDSFDGIIDTFNTQSVKRLSKVFGITEGQISKARKHLNNFKYPKYKIDTIEKCDSVQISENLWRIEDAKLVLPQKKKYPHLYGNKDVVRPREEIEKIFNDPTYPKTFRVGVNPDDSHKSRIPLEVLLQNHVAKAQFERIDEAGNIRGPIDIDIGKVRKILGKDSWLEKNLRENKHIGTSIALHSIDRPKGNYIIEKDLDVRSLIFTRLGRNEDAGGS